MEALVQQLSQASMGLHERTQRILEEQCRGNEQLRQALLDRLNASDAPQTVRTHQPDVPTVGHFMPKMTNGDDIEAYLQAFERTAKREKWPPEQWAGLLAPFLIGPAQRAYLDLDSDAAADYGKLTTEILKRYDLSPPIQAQRFHEWEFRPSESPRSQMYELMRVAAGWLQPNHLTVTQVVERLVVDRYLRALPYKMKEVASQANPQTSDQLVALVERHQVTSALLKPSRSERSPQYPESGRPGRSRAPRHPDEGRQREVTQV